MLKTKVKKILVLFSVVVLAIATATIALFEIRTIRTISGLTLAPVLLAMIGFGLLTMIKDFKSFKELYEAADDE